MRISDWSSDVCSSDLRGLQGVLRGISRVTYGRPARITTVLVALFAVGSIYTALQIRIGNPVEGSSLLWHDSEYNEAVRQINAHFQIGRASCRERVCQYV